MLWFIQIRRLVSALLLLAFLTPALGLIGASAGVSVDHSTMHHGDHAIPASSADVDQITHDRMLCSIMIPCEHGFCSVLSMLPDTCAGKTLRAAFEMAAPSVAISATPESQSPPPRSHS